MFGKTRLGITRVDDFEPNVCTAHADELCKLSVSKFMIVRRLDWEEAIFTGKAAISP